MEAELESRKVSAKFRESQQFEALGILAHGIVSDLKSSFAQAAEETEKVAEEIDSDSRLKNSLDRTRHVADRSVAVIEDLLSLSAFDSDQQSTNINDTVQNFINTEKIQQLIEETGVSINTQLSEAIQPVSGSTLHVQRILENLERRHFTMVVMFPVEGDAFFQRAGPDQRSQDPEQGLADSLFDRLDGISLFPGIG